MFYLKSRHLILWSPGTLTDQYRFYDTRLVNYAKEKILLSIKRPI